jgi:four helix bundle suffix protein
MSGGCGLDGLDGRSGENGKVGRVSQYGPGGQSERREEPGNRLRKEGESLEEGLIPRHGGYRKLKSFQVAQLAFDVTVRFCDRYVNKFSRTNDQMVQAARSGVQNIAEGSEASGTSKKTELKLTGVARSSLEELRLDYEDFLRQHSLPVWARSDPRRGNLIARRCTGADEVEQWMRQMQEKSNDSMGRRGSDPSSVSTRSTGSMPSTESRESTPTKETKSSASAEIMANAALALIAVAGSLLDRQLATLAREFEEKGGFTERMYQRRVQRRNRPH